MITSIGVMKCQIPKDKDIGGPLHWYKLKSRGCTMDITIYLMNSDLVLHIFAFVQHIVLNWQRTL